jgi:GDP-mannose 6-dehydrogenase
VNIAKLVGANRDYILNHIPHISKLMQDNLDGVVKHAEVIVVGNKSDEFAGILDKVSGGQTVIDLVRICDQKSDGLNYEGICW